jgi:hypothetical protein
MTDVDHAAEVRRLIEEARKLLEQPAPDTFLGRKTVGPPSSETSVDDIPLSPVSLH